MPTAEEEFEITTQLDRDMHNCLRDHLSRVGFNAEVSASPSGDTIVQLGDDVGLMVFVEIYDQDSGDSKRVPISEIARNIPLCK